MQMSAMEKRESEVWDKERRVLEVRKAPPIK
jgi:hypothetical protein